MVLSSVAPLRGTLILGHPTPGLGLSMVKRLRRKILHLLILFMFMPGRFHSSWTVAQTGHGRLIDDVGISPEGA
jgi:hypothetical protein